MLQGGSRKLNWRSVVAMNSFAYFFATSCIGLSMASCPYLGPAADEAKSGCPFAGLKLPTALENSTKLTVINARHGHPPAVDQTDRRSQDPDPGQEGLL